MNASIETLPTTNDQWQLKVLPFMTRAIAVMGLLFFLSSFVQIHLMHVELQTAPEVEEASASLDDLESPAKAELMRWNALVTLERETLRAREQATNAVILRQASLLNLGFLTGMVLCLVGAVFVLGRLQEPATSLSGETPQLKVALNTSSPGIVLVVLGAGLICATLFHHYQFNLPDKTVYLPPAQYTLSIPSGTPQTSATLHLPVATAPRDSSGNSTSSPAPLP